MVSFIDSARKFLNVDGVLNSHEMGGRQFPPTCKLKGSLLEGMGSHIFSSFFTSISRLPFLKYCLWNVVNPLELSDSCGQAS
jgi:hypothetical protein